MKIVMFIIRHHGGHGTVARCLKKELEKLGHEVDIYSREDDWAIKSFSLGAVREWETEIGKNYDIIYTSDWSMALPLLFPYPVHGKKHFCCFHGHQPGKTRFIQTLVGKWMQGKGKLVVVGDTLKERFPQAHLVYNGVDTKQFYDMKKKRDCIGMIKRDYELWNEEDLNLAAKMFKLKPLLIDKIPFEKMNEMYNKCQMFVSYPAAYTGFNVCWLEAKAAGVPEILYNNSGIGSKLNKLNIKDFSWKKSAKKLSEVFHGLSVS